MRLALRHPRRRPPKKEEKGKRTEEREGAEDGEGRPHRQSPKEKEREEVVPEMKEDGEKEGPRPLVKQGKQQEDILKNFILLQQMMISNHTKVSILLVN